MVKSAICVFGSIHLQEAAVPMSYKVKEVYVTLQGEGARSGTTAVFCRFTGCNLWSGLEKDRELATCQFCDTDFRGIDGDGGGRFATAEALATHIFNRWHTVTQSEPGFIVFTGGEPLLQLDHALIQACHKRGFEVGVETNGTLPAPDGIDWLCVSPKANAPLHQTEGHELKLVFPQAGIAPDQLEHLQFKHFFLQPMDGDALQDNVSAAIAYCQRNPTWRLSLQTHKWMGIP